MATLVDESCAPHLPGHKVGRVSEIGSMGYLGAMRAGALAVVFGCVPAIAHAETLKEALSSAYTNNPTIMSALLDVKSTAEGIALAKSGKLPTIGISATSGATWQVGNPSPTAEEFSVNWGQVN